VVALDFDECVYVWGGGGYKSERLEGGREGGSGSAARALRRRVYIHAHMHTTYIYRGAYFSQQVFLPNTKSRSKERMPMERSASAGWIRRREGSNRCRVNILQTKESKINDIVVGPIRSSCHQIAGCCEKSTKEALICYFVDRSCSDYEDVSDTLSE